MKHTITRNVIDIIGHIWQPTSSVCALELDLTSYDMENIGDIHSREDVERWISTHTYDFSDIVDFRADFDYKGVHVDHLWNDENSEIKFNDCMYPEDIDE